MHGFCCLSPLPWPVSGYIIKDKPSQLRHKSIENSGNFILSVLLPLPLPLLAFSFKRHKSSSRLEGLVSICCNPRLLSVSWLCIYVSSSSMTKILA